MELEIKKEKKGKTLKLLLIALILLVFCIAFISLLIGGESDPQSVEEIVLKYFPGAEVEFNQDTKNLYINAKEDRNSYIDVAVMTEGGNLADCVKDVMQFNPEVNFQDVTIYSDSFPVIITCVFNPDALHQITDWSSFSRSDLQDVCLAYATGEQ